jgi:DNA (cytosine-5)-methyltransferase 1
MTTIAFCEQDAFCRKVLAKHWPDIPIYQDVCTLTGEQVRRDVGDIELICGGFPCQDISYAGKGAGIEGERSGLWTEYARLIGELRPRYALVENVSALLTRGLGTVLGDLAALGYDAEWDSIPAAAVGSRQLRDRLWIVAAPRALDNADSFNTRRLTGSPPKEGWWTTDSPKRPRFGWGEGAREPAVARVAYGIRNRLDRLVALGNSAHPDNVEIIGRAIMETA